MWARETCMLCFSTTTLTSNSILSFSGKLDLFYGKDCLLPSLSYYCLGLFLLEYPLCLTVFFYFKSEPTSYIPLNSLVPILGTKIFYFAQESRIFKDLVMLSWYYLEFLWKFEILGWKSENSFQYLSNWTIPIFYSRPNIRFYLFVALTNWNASCEVF